MLVVGSLAAYSLRRFRWPVWVSAAFLGWTLVFHMVPVLTLIGPWYIAFRDLGLYDTRAALVLTHVTINLPMTVWLMTAFLREIPPEIEEAAQVDGCTPLEAFLKVVLPLVGARPDRRGHPRVHLLAGTSSRSRSRSRRVRPRRCRSRSRASHSSTRRSTRRWPRRR